MDNVFRPDNNYFEISAFKVFFYAHLNELEVMNEFTIVNVFYLHLQNETKKISQTQFFCKNSHLLNRTVVFLKNFVSKLSTH